MTGRPSMCGFCGECARCKRAVYMRGWWNRKTLEEKRAAIARRDAGRVKKVDRERGRAGRNRGHKREITAAVREAQRAWAKRNPEKRLAHSRVAHALENGSLVRRPCEVCGVENSHAHHEDYSNALEVRWLCPIHHGEVHRIEDVAA